MDSECIDYPKLEAELAAERAVDYDGLTQPPAREVEDLPMTPDVRPLNIDIGAGDGVVILKLSRPVDTVAMHPRDARRFADLVRKQSYNV